MGQAQRRAAPRAGTANGKTKKYTGTALSIPNNQELFLFSTKEFYPHVIRNPQCKLLFLETAVM